MGLLDMFGTSMDDPRTGATLQLAQGLLSSPRVMQGLAGGLSGYQQAMAQARQQKALEDYRALQMQQMQAQMLAQRKQQEQAELDTGLTRKAFTAVKPIEANAASGIMGPRPEALAPVGKLPSFDPAAFIASGGSPEVAFSLKKALAPEGPMITKAGDVARDRKTGKVIWQNDDKDSLPADFKLYQLSGAQERGMTFDQWDLQRKRAGASSTTVSYGAPVAGVDAGGNPVFFQPSKDGGRPAIIPGVAPPKPKLGEKQTNQNAGIDALGMAVDDYVARLDTWKKPDILNADKRAEMGTVYKNLMLQAKEAYNLGVLNGPDLEILHGVVQDPATIVGTVTSNEALARQAVNLKRIMNKIKAANIGGKPPEPAAPAAPAGISLDAIEAEIARRRAARGG